MAVSTSNDSSQRKRCFVVMGFGTKTDYATGRKLDLNKSYRLLIKPVVEQKGLICIRADEIRHSGAIDVPMYQELLKADVVIADLSTANMNTFYELGIRHALRPRTTIVISEDKLAYPFDLNHINITPYTHLGEGIEYEEVERFRKLLGEILQTVLDRESADSPVYTFLNGLTPPRLEEEIEKAVQSERRSKETQVSASGTGETRDKPRDETLSLLIEKGEEALDQKDYPRAKVLFESAHNIGKGESSNISSGYDYVIHRLALAVYKSEEPDPVSALQKALQLLVHLDLAHTNDPETVTIAGAIEKKWYDISGNEEHLSNAILFYQRGYFLLNNRYNGINLAYMLNCRANSTLCVTKEEQIADLVNASRARERVIYLCDKDLAKIEERKNRESQEKNADEEFLNQQALDTEQKFWISVNKAEAYFGLGMFEQYENGKKLAQSIEHKPWMMESFEGQINKLRNLLLVNGNLMNPAWQEPDQRLSK
ncbi:tetratricopeptide repeat-containing protein [Flavitalea sp.]|nr:tetratricopeptide repeat-containing protein [Flavitalea sp.]